MTYTECLEMSARAWCDEKTEHIEMNGPLAEVFADMLFKVYAEVDELHAELASARTVERKDLHEQIAAAQAEALGLRLVLATIAVRCAEGVVTLGQIEHLARMALAAQPAATGEGDK